MAHSASTQAYPFAIVRTETGFSAGGLQFPSLATAETRAQLLELLREQVALHLLECGFEGRTPGAPKPGSELDLSDYHEEGDDPEVVYVDPAPVSVVSTAIERARREEGVSYAELARRMEVPRSVVTRITNPFYFGHTTRTLRSVAQALGREVHVSLDKPGNGGHRSDKSRPLVTA